MGLARARSQGWACLGLGRALTLTPTQTLTLTLTLAVAVAVAVALALTVREAIAGRPRERQPCRAVARPEGSRALTHRPASSGTPSTWSGLGWGGG